MVVVVVRAGQKRERKGETHQGKTHRARAGSEGGVCQEEWGCVGFCLMSHNVYAGMTCLDNLQPEVGGRIISTSSSTSGRHTQQQLFLKPGVFTNSQSRCTAGLQT